MRVFSTASIISQAFKNVGRASEIVRVFSMYGFSEFVEKMKLSRFLTKKAQAKGQNLPTEVRLRLVFENLGPAFVKFGQLLATRADLVPDNFVREFKKLQDHVPAAPFEQVKEQIESELNRSIEECFSSFDEKPLAAASIAQVYGATLRTGEQVAVKVQRPGIQKLIQNDISILRGLAALLERYVPESRLVNPMGIVDEFFQSITWELDFRVEANNMRRIRKNLSPVKDVAVPLVYSEFSSAKLLTLERFFGVRFSDREAIIANNIEPEHIVEVGCNAFFRMVMHDGLFHGDLHAGNLFVLNDGRIGIIDFGIVGRLSKRVKDSVTSMFIAIMDEDYESLAAEYIALSHATGECDIQQLQKDLMDLISPYIGMALGEVNVGHILLRSTNVAAQHNLRVPRELMLLFKALVTIEGLGKSLDPGFDLLPVGNRLARQALASRYSKEQIAKDLILMGRDLQSIAETAPRLLKRFLRRLSQNNFAFETKSKDIHGLSISMRLVAYTLLMAVSSVTSFALGIAFISLNKGPIIADISILGALFVLGGASIQTLCYFKVRKFISWAEL